MHHSVNGKYWLGGYQPGQHFPPEFNMLKDISSQSFIMYSINAIVCTIAHHISNNLKVLLKIIYYILFLH